MVANSKNLKGFLKAIEAPPDRFSAELEVQQKAERRHNLWTLRLWIVALLFTVPPGLIAAGILICSFGRQLWAAI
jgi:hypothetical protein